MVTKFECVANQVASELGVTRAGAADALRSALGKHAPEVNLHESIPEVSGDGPVDGAHAATEVDPS